MHVILEQMPFLDPALLLGSQFPEDLTRVLPQLAVQRLPAALRDEDHVKTT
jgi:hypothetical protein